MAFERKLKKKRKTIRAYKTIDTFRRLINAMFSISPQPSHRPCSISLCSHSASAATHNLHAAKQLGYDRVLRTQFLRNSRKKPLKNSSRPFTTRNLFFRCQHFKNKARKLILFSVCFTAATTVQRPDDSGMLHVE